MPSNDRPKLQDWDEESMRRLFGEVDEVTRSVLTHLAQPENAGGIRQQEVGRVLELQGYIPKVVRDLKRRARREFRRHSPVLETETEGARNDPVLVMREGVAELVRAAEGSVEAVVVDRTSHDGADAEPPPATTGPRPVRSGVVRVYEAGTSGGPHPIRFVKEVWRHRKLMFVLSRSAIKAQSNHTIMGQLWIFLEPLLFAATYVILVGILRGGELGGGRIQRLIFSLFLFAFTRVSMQRGASAVRGNPGLLMNSSFPRSLLPSTTVLQAFQQLVPSLLLYAAVHVLSGMPVGRGLVALPGLLLLQVMFSLGLAMLLATIAVYIPDVEQTLPFVTRLWMYTTPVLYTVSDLRGNLEAILGIIKWNPLFHLFAAYHRVLDGQWPTGLQLGISAAWATAFLTIGFLVFSSKERELVTRI